MRWLVFDVVVGAALVWLVWQDARDRGAVPPAVEAAPAVARLAERDGPAAVAPQPGPVPVTAAMPEPMPTPDPAAAPSAEDRGRRLRALARDAEALFLRGRE